MVVDPLTFPIDVSVEGWVSTDYFLSSVSVDFDVVNDYGL